MFNKIMGILFIIIVIYILATKPTEALSEIKFFDMRIKTYDCQFDCEYIIRDNRCLIRTTDIIQKLGYKIKWVEKTKSIIITNNGVIAMFQLNSKYVYVRGIEQDFGFKMDTKLTVINGHTYMPIKYIGEAFGFETNYSDKNGIKKIEISNGG